MMEDISLEDLARGVVPKKDDNGKKPETVSDVAKKRIKRMADLALAQESLSIKGLKKFNPTELKLMKHAADELQESLYRTKNMIRNAMPEDEKKEGTIAIKMGKC